MESLKFIGRYLFMSYTTFLLLILTDPGLAPGWYLLISGAIGFFGAWGFGPIESKQA